eukprot:TRINITY_DN107847_c0_g1_i1.p1 TRINITY_DN107847_c0_g1~~TRINITY_DN107847_c0_g1_i1.p1  ORF type:complete len:329 (-),score=58.61 TRINITY_DN107847_c0_g1_i1:27-980(-)
MTSTLELHRPAPLSIVKKPALSVAADTPAETESSALALVDTQTLATVTFSSGEAAIYPGVVEEGAAVPAASRGMALSAVQDRRGADTGLFVAECVQRQSSACFVQGTMPVTPGEQFTVRVLGLGLFGEIGVGLAGVRSDLADGASMLQPDMVGWSNCEAGLHGDHGSCYVGGRIVKKHLSPAWAVDDVIECGLTIQGYVYFKHNGQSLVELPGRWHIGVAYPTVTLRSAAAKVELDFRSVQEKPLKDLLPHTSLPQTDRAVRAKSTPLSLLQSFKGVLLPESVLHPGPGVSFLEKMFGPVCACDNLEVKSKTSAIVA